MEISINSLLEGATQATGSVAVIDVFRAFTTAAVALANGASKIVMVRTVKEALELRQAGIGEICMGEVHGRVPMASISETRPSRSRLSISRARRSSNERVPVHRGSLRRQPRPKGFTRLPWSRQRRPSVPFYQAHRIRFRLSRWATMASAELTRMNCAQSTFGIGSKADRAMQTLFVASFWPVARLGAFTIRLVHTCTLRTWTSLSISTATISQ
jgi:hypothetical protein